MAFVYAWKVSSLADQLLPQPLMEQLDTLHLQYGLIELMDDEVWFGEKW